ncbi:prephenate dehydrogenase [Brucepastera parasyntrophica]|uniref:prephenate dehydrogenase n=1 Tax=Brucepastera parasyntrophica TaxID=2880008 RepID=UPI00210C2595|nr:prephenate dehydrogenase [Brucepastera parasyntrophica]ULQ59643.1 prephenate dehydrogenase [Brucepastera parasyntrophica]
MKDLGDCIFGFVGLGLMGGALARSLRSGKIIGKKGKIFAFDINSETLRTACDSGTIDEGFADPGIMLKQCDVVYVCLNPLSGFRFMETYMNAFQSGSLITDIAGVKKNIVTRIENILRSDIDFIPGHPMAGSEKEGFAHAHECSFSGKNYILVPLKKNRPENLSFMKKIIRQMGFAKIIETDAETHDMKIAFTSQLCHILAASLIDCESDISITDFGGGSFEDLTRIAMINAPMWTELFLENAEPLISRMEKFEKSFAGFKQMIQASQKEKLCDTLTGVRKKRIAMSDYQRA